ncbi:phytanoyl-CoA dioxygenase family protein [Terrimonas rubra]|uniref:Phytanoyl-CoA dioxygenase family protein n=1 Tax=Terrimonas rubra TaxID=1035890 RepID=A0ABW6A5W2_9BACT
MTVQQQLRKDGFVIVDNLYTTEEVNNIIQQIENTDTGKTNFRKSADLFAIRQFLKEVPQVAELIFTQKVKNLLTGIMGQHYFVVKSIYFDKPGSSNWYVAYHQDLTISVDKKKELQGFINWTQKHNQFAVQPPVQILENITTIRIHLDDTDENNGALKVIPGSHLKKIYRPETIDWSVEQEVDCPVKQGGIMFMKPLTLHSSGRSTNHKKRRVIHIELSSQELPGNLLWSEKEPVLFLQDQV